MTSYFMDEVLSCILGGLRVLLVVFKFCISIIITIGPLVAAIIMSGVIYHDASPAWYVWASIIWVPFALGAIYTAIDRGHF